MSSTKSQVALATNIPSIPSSQSQKDYGNEESLGRQNSFGNNRRGNMKGKHLTRSHAMRESTSPPRTPTPRSDHNSSSVSSSNGQSSNYQNHHYQQHLDANDNVNNNNNNSKMHVQSGNVRGNSPLSDGPVVIVTSQHKQQQQHQNVAAVLNSEDEFPKLTPPKSNKSNSNNNNNSNGNSNNGGGCGNGSSGSGSGGGGGINSHHQQQQQQNRNNTNGTDGGNNSNSANNNNSGYKKIINDMKSNVNDTHKNNINHNYSNTNNNSCNSNNSSKQQNAQQQSSHVANSSNNSYNQGISVVGDNQQQQQQHLSSPAPTPIYNSAMNYQLNESIAPQQQQHYDKDNRCPRNESQNSNLSTSCEEDSSQQSHHNYERNVMSGGSGGGGGGSNNGGGNNKKNRTSSNSKVFNNSENSGEQYTDYGGTDLLSFFKETLNRTSKDRIFLLKTEKELIDLIQDKSRSEYRFPANTSYNRMLLHRTAAYFGMEHNVDNESQQCVIVNVTKNTRIPDVRFKSLVRDREDSRKSILKRDTHSFDEARQSSYLCPDRGMLDRKAKSFEEREEDYERARSRIFNRSQMDCNESGEETYLSWNNSIDQSAQQQMSQQQQSIQQQQSNPQQQGSQQQSRGNRTNGKMSKSQNSSEGRDSRTPNSSNKNHNYGGYNGPPSSNNNSGNGQQIMRGDSSNSNKNSNTRSFQKHDSNNGNNTQWRLSPSNNSSGGGNGNGSGGGGGGSNSSSTIYHFDPTNLPSNQNIGSYQSVQTLSYSPNHQQSQNPKSKSARMQQSKNVQQTIEAASTGVTSKVSSTVGTINEDDMIPHQNVNMDSPNNEIMQNNANICEGVDQPLVEENIVYIEENGSGDNANKVVLNHEECDNDATNCLSITTTTSTKNYDRIEVQKFKNQATSPNIPNEKDEVPNRENSISSDGSEQPEQTPSRNQPPNNPTPLSASSTPFSSSESTTKHTTNSDEHKTATWTYTTSYQAPDGSTVFHTTATPNGNPYCTTAYQQAPDGSLYAVPQGMVYAYPQPVEGEVQGFLMPVLDANSQRSEGPTLIPAGAHAIYPATGATTTMMPIATAYPAAQFASATSAPIYPASQVIYSTEQFTPGGAAIAATAAPANGQLQQIPMTTYPIGYSYPYNGYWGQNIAYYVPQQALGNAVAATPILSGPPQPGPPQVAGGASIAAGAHVAGGVGITNIAPGAAAAGPPSTNQISLAGSGGANAVVTAAGVGSNSSTHTAYQAPSGTTYYGTGRIKRPSGGPHFNSVQQTSHPQIVAAIPSNNGATATYQLAHAVPALALAHSNVVAGSNELGAQGGAPATAMYALPQPATLYPANVYPYAAAAGASGGTLQSAPQAHTPGSSNAPGSTQSAHVSGGHGPQANAMIATSPFYGHPPPLHGQATTTTLHAPGPSAIPIVDPATVAAPQTNSSSTSYSAHSTPSTPHSAPNQAMQQRNAPLFSTPPLLTSGGNSHGYSNSSTPHYYSNDHQGGASGNSAGGNTNSPQSISYSSSNYEKRNNSKKSYSSNTSRALNSSYVLNNGSNKQPLLTSVETSRSSPANNNGYHHHSTRGSHGMSKRGGGGHEKTHQAPLLSAPPASLYNPGVPNNTSSYHASHQHSSEGGQNTVTSKPPSRLNAGAATFRQKSTSVTNTGGRGGSQRNSPATNSSNENSNNNSPNSLAGTSTNSAATTPNTPMTTSYLNSSAVAYTPNTTTTAEIQSLAHQTPVHTASVFIPRGSYIPPQNQHNTSMITTTGASGIGGTNATVATAGGHPTAATAVLGGTVATAATLGTYNPAAASGVYFKYGQTYFAHPSVALPNSRRSPSTDIRPPIAQMAGMYPAVNMMIAAPPRHAQGRHPHPNYRGTRPPR